jgi:trans-aconitate methyltransferase
MLKLITDFIDRKIIRNRQARMNHQYSKGAWEFLKDPIEFERQEVCNLFLQQYKPNSSIIEIGCSEGMFVEHIIKKDTYSKYVGIDVSDYIVQKAAARLTDDKTMFRQDDMDKFTIKEAFDVVFFNESINYAKSITKTLQYASNHLMKPNGIFIISLHEHKHSPGFWQEIHKTLKPLESQRISNRRGNWQVEVLKPIESI